MHTLDSFFQDHEPSRRIFDELYKAFEGLSPSKYRVMKSQIVFTRRKDFAWVWIPAQYLRGRGLAALVLTLAYPARQVSPRWKEVVEPYPGRFIHHLELFTAAEIDEEVLGWLRERWAAAG